MKSSLVILTGIALSACLADDATSPEATAGPETTERQSESAEVQVPPELVLDKSPQASCAAIGYSWSNGLCAVAIVCHDSRANCHPTYCFRGSCTITDVVNHAVSLCNNNCSNATNCAFTNLFNVCP